MEHFETKLCIYKTISNLITELAYEELLQLFSTCGYLKNPQMYISFLIFQPLRGCRFKIVRKQQQKFHFLDQIYSESSLVA